MKLQMTKTISGLKPCYSIDSEVYDKMKLGNDYEVTIKQPRNYKFHKKYFALINLGYENQGKYNNADHYRKVMQLKAGYYETIETDKGTIYLPLSISFGSMDNVEFEDLYESVLTVICEELGLGSEEMSSEVERQLEGF